MQNSDTSDQTPVSSTDVEFIKVEIERERLRLEAERQKTDYELKVRELDLKARELEVSRKTGLTPITTAIIAGCTAIIGAIAGAIQQGSANLSLEKSKLESSLILKAIATGNEDEAVKNLKFFINTRLIEDKNGKILGAVEKAPHSIPVLPASDYVRLGVNNAQSGQLQDAIVAYRKALASDPRDAMTFNLLGYALFKLGRMEEALVNLRHSVKLNPSLIWGHYNLSLVLWTAGQ